MWRNGEEREAILAAIEMSENGYRLEKKSANNGGYRRHRNRSEPQ